MHYCTGWKINYYYYYYYYEEKLGFAHQVLTSVSCEGLPELVGQVGLFITVLNRMTSQCVDLYAEKFGFARQVLTLVGCGGFPELVSHVHSCTE